MARVVAHLPDLLFGSKVQGMLAAAGHDVAVAGTAQAASSSSPAPTLLVARPLRGRGGAARGARPAHLGDADARLLPAHRRRRRARAALAAGFDLVVPRSRMAREGAALVDGLLAADVSA